jgi:hypothetical protein
MRGAIPSFRHMHSCRSALLSVASKLPPFYLGRKLTLYADKQKCRIFLSVFLPYVIPLFVSCIFSFISKTTGWNGREYKECVKDGVKNTIFRRAPECYKRQKFVPFS